ncbi:hypothetical protein DFH07DRAFT_763257 [Mycena maculata]|uniref:F-box domain-containing protein n=1 Tax=Mycena maculata TaxID=230809 RepID=A0AAD7MF62_9AGAR|nr:hypothetical protein DFH07DRAFT_763257 [Mycena maculata]
MICAHVGTVPHHVDRPTKDESPGRDLSVLARTATIFLDPALNVLWRQQNTIVNVLNCMPADLWDISETRNEGDTEFIVTISPKRAIKPIDWERASFYSRRVKLLNIDEECWFKTLDFFEAISLCPPGDFIFPNLERLNWCPEPSTSFQHVRLFLAPRITNLSLGPIHSIAHLSILSSLASRFPSLSNFVVDIHCVPISVVTPSISSLVRAFISLETVYVPALDKPAFAHVAQLPGLRSLALSSDEAPLYGLDSSSASVQFPALTSLSMPSMKHAAALLVTLANWSLTCFTSEQSDQSAATARQLYAALADHCSHCLLRNLSIRGGVFGTSAIPTATQLAIYSIGADIIRPLLSFSNLVTVWLSHPVGFDLDDAMIRDMASAWPSIEVLHLTADVTYRHRYSRVTLEGIYAFAKHCPRLDNLDITFDATFVPKIRVKGKKRVFQRTLRIIDVAASPISQPTRVAKFLSTIFPRLMSINTLFEDLAYGDHDDEEAVIDPHVRELHEVWMEVLDDLVTS